MSTNTPLEELNLLHPKADVGECACGGQCGCGSHGAKDEAAEEAPAAFTPSACGHSKFPPRDSES